MKSMIDSLNSNSKTAGNRPRRVLAAFGALVLALGVSACGEQDQQTESMTDKAEKGMQAAKKAGQDAKKAGKEAAQGAKKSADKTMEKMGAAPAPGAAATSGKPPSPEFKALDSNGDGQISAKEAKTDPKLSQSYQKLDSNGDGQLSKTEFSANESGKMGDKPAGGKQTSSAQPAGKQASGAQPAGQSKTAVENPNRPKDLN